MATPAIMTKIANMANNVMTPEDLNPGFMLGLTPLNAAFRPLIPGENFPLEWATGHGQDTRITIVKDENDRATMIPPGGGCQ